MMYLWLTVWEDGCSPMTAFRCEPSKADFLWQLADVYVRAGWHYNVQLISTVKGE